MIYYDKFYRTHSPTQINLFNHLKEISQIARVLAEKLNLADAGELLGLIHDFGKYSQAFQEYIREQTGINPDIDIINDTALPNNQKIDHSTSGAQWVYQNFANLNHKDLGELFGQMLSLCIASHHGVGLIDCIYENGKDKWYEQICKEDKFTHLTECLQNADPNILERAKELIEPAAQSLYSHLKSLLKDFNKSQQKKIDEFYLGCVTRFLFSCLIDADRMNSADFEYKNENQRRILSLNQKTDWQIAINQLEEYLQQWQPKSPIDEIRQNISKNCLERGKIDSQNIYTLTVPTGGGKTLSSLRYALHHAPTHNLDHIIYIIPYTSIIEQNAQEVRKILGEKWVLEHHSNLDPAHQNWQNKLLAENWDKPIVFTTMVQFLDSWFGSGTRGVRHIHSMTNSILIFDEIQTLPIKCVYLFCNTLNWLIEYGKSTAILCTATQPILDKLPSGQFGQLNLPKNAEIIPNVTELFSQLNRVDVQFCKKLQGWSVEETGNFLLEQFEQFQSCLLIVNTKKWAKDVYQYCKNKGILAESLFHLSTHQYPAHRKTLFTEMKQRLKNSKPVLCISTQLIEAGVDISMKCVIRALAGLDSIAQAAGRCNRHGELEKGKVWVLNLQEPNLENYLPEIAEAQKQVSRAEFEQTDMLQPKNIELFFNYYFYNRTKEMTYPMKKSGDSIFNWLSDNSCNPYANKNKNRRIPLLMQSFKRSGKAFNVIDSPTHAVIVPYGNEGKELIDKLRGKYDPRQFREYLRKAQQYSINIFQELQNNKVIYPIADTGIYYVNYIKHNVYNNEYGLSL